MIGKSNNIKKHLFDIGNEKTIHVTCSIGGASFPFVSSHKKSLTWQQTLTLSDKALYAAKENGRDSWVILFEKNISDIDYFLDKISDDLPLLLEQDTLFYKTSITDRDVKF